MWTPTDRELVMSWLAFHELRKRGRVSYNLWSKQTKGIPPNAREFLAEWNERGMDIVTPNGHCVMPETLPTMLAQEFGREVETIFTSEKMAAGLSELERADQLASAALAPGKRLLPFHLRDLRKEHLTAFAKGVSEAASPLAGFLFLTYWILVWMESSGTPHWFLLASLPVFLSFGWNLVGNALHPARFFHAYEKTRATHRVTIVADVALQVSVFLAAFIVVASSANASFGEHFTGSSSPVTWVIYGLEQTGGALLLDVAEVYRLRFSGIEHANAFLPATCVFLFRAVLGATVISLTAAGIARYRSSVDVTTVRLTEDEV